MKLVNSLGIVILSIVLLACGNSNNKNSNNPYAKFKLFETNDYSIQFSNTWRLDTTGYMGTDFAIFSRQTSLLDKFIENVNLQTTNITDSTLDLTQFKRLQEEKIKDKAVDFELIESKMITDNNQEYYKLIFTKKESIFILKTIQYYWLANNKAYVLSFACKANEFKKYEETGMLMMDSFKLK